MAVTASFDSGAGVLSEFGDNLDNTITTSRDAAGTILVNGGAVPILGGTPTVANTSLISVFGLGESDTIALDQTNGALPRANLFGGVGNDTITGGSGGDQLFGQSGNDTLNGRGGFDFLFGGADDDVLTGGDDDDQVFGESGNDRMIWNPGDDTDLFEGGADTDTAEVNGGNGGETFTITANGTRVRFDRLDPAPFSLDIGTTENLVLNANGGDDVISTTGDLAALISLTIDGGAGNDTILGGNGADLLLGGDGNDFVDGQQGNDVAFLGAGDDTFQWDPGDGSDTVEGQDGTDTLLFNGSGGAEIFEVLANGGRALFTRNLGNIVMDLNDVERIDLNALGQADTITVNDLTGTDVTRVDVDLAGVVGGTTGDAQPDTVIVNDANGDNQNITVSSAGGIVAVNGLAAQVTIDHAEAVNDQLVVNGLGGNDFINATGLAAGAIKLTLDGGAGDDTLAGGFGADTFLGGAGKDIVAGRQGNDLAFLGADDDTFFWNPGDGSDTVEGQDGTDTLGFRGANANENVDISANGGRVRFFRDVASITMDLDDVERVVFDALGGADNIVVGDLSGTDAAQVDINLASTIGGSSPDGQVDNVSANGTNGDDVVGVTGANGVVSVAGLAAQVNITRADAGLDFLTVNSLGGDDVIDASGLVADQINLSVEGGLGEDLIIGSQGNDTVRGGDGNDTALLGAGNDVFIWNPGDDNDTIEGQAGSDRLAFFGANVAENIDIAANGGRVRFFRDIANVTMDLNDTETITFSAFGGADNIVVNDLSGTDATQVAIDLAGVFGGTAGDGQVDRVTIQGTNGDDQNITVANAGGVITVNGLAAQVTIDHAEATDQLVINGLAGDDFINATGLTATAMKLTFDGGAGNDTLAGGAGIDTFFGGAGNDTVAGRQGNDQAFLDAGNDTFFWNPGDGSDLVEGGTDFDVLGFRGANVNENIDISANGGRALFFRDVANVTMDLNDVERIEFGAIGGSDNVAVNDLSGTDVLRVAVDLAGTLGGSAADGQLDQVTVIGSNGNDQISITNQGGLVIVNGLAAQSTVDHVDATDQLTVHGSGGTDTIDASALTPNVMALTLNGGAGNDTLTGSAGADQFLFTLGNDTITNFSHAQGDVVEVRGMGVTSFAQLQALMVDNGAVTTVNFGGGNVLNLAGLDPNQFQASDFLFS
jgi:Ca2+-binding RTX toxin-like protein